MNMRLHYFKNVILGFFFCAAFMVSALAYAQYPGFGDPGSGQVGDSAGLVAVMPSVAGGAIPLGSTAQVVVLFRNEGGQPVQTGLIRLYPSSTVSAEVTLNQCEEEPLPPGAECAIALSVKALQAGNWRVEMLMSHSGRTRLVTATLAGSVELNSEGGNNVTSDIEAIPNNLNFGSLNNSQTLVEPIILRNITSKPINISSIYIDTSEQAGYNLKAECSTLEAGQACIAIVSWSPKIQGRSSGVLVVEHSGPTGLASIPLKGEYLPSDVNEANVFPQAVPGKGLLVSSQTELEFGSSVETASTLTVSLVNAGDSRLTIDDIRISGSDNGLGFKGDGCSKGTVLNPIEACPLTLTWSPTRVGPVIDDIQVVHDGARGILVLPVRGTAISAVSQDQKAIVLSDDSSFLSSFEQGGEMGDVTDMPLPTPVYRAPQMANPASVLDGYKITSFSSTRAIINGPGGSRIVFGNEEVVIGGIPWFVVIQKNGIEFLHQGRRVLLLFDRSLSGGGAGEVIGGGGA